MDNLRVLIASRTLARRTGTELYVRDLAFQLLEQGITPIVYSPRLGPIASELRARTIPVVERLSAVGTPPDVIHGNHNIEAMEALLHFPGVPAVYVYHDNMAAHSQPPRFPRILRYVPVDYTCRDRLVFEHGIPTERVQVVFNSVDLARFQPRAPLPTKPKRALVFSNHSSFHLTAVREACERHGIELDVVGAQAGNAAAQPEEVLGHYDLVFAKARSALEAMAVGTAVVLCDFRGVGPMVTSGELDQLRAFNFGHRTLKHPIHPDELAREIARYDAADAAQVSQRIRSCAGLDVMADEIVALYHEVIDEQVREPCIKADEEGRAAAEYVHWLAEQWEQAENKPLTSLPGRVKGRLGRVPLWQSLSFKLKRGTN